MTKKPSNLTHKDKVTTKRTHDNYRDFETRKKESDGVLYHSLKKENGQLIIETSKEFSLLEENGILEAARRLYREEIGIQ